MGPIALRHARGRNLLARDALRAAHGAGQVNINIRQLPDASEKGLALPVSPVAVVVAEQPQHGTDKRMAPSELVLSEYLIPTRLELSCWTAASEPDAPARRAVASALARRAQNKIHGEAVEGNESVPVF